MALVQINDSILTAIANSTRTKSGATGQLTMEDAAKKLVDVRLKYAGLQKIIEGTFDMTDFDKYCSAAEVPWALEKMFYNSTVLAGKVSIPESCTLIETTAFNGCQNITKLYIPWAESSVSLADSICSNCATTLEIYTDAESQPSSWNSTFNKINNSASATVHYGVSKAEFDLLPD